MGTPGPEHLIVGWVQKPHGLKGELVVRLETDHPEAVFRPGRVLILADRAGTPDGGTLTVERSRPFKDGLLVKAAEHTRVESALELKGRTLLMLRTEAAPPADDELFYHEAVGLRVVTADGEVGTVSELYETPSGYLLGVKTPAGKEILVPFVREMVRRLDREARELELEVPAGLLDL